MRMGSGLSGSRKCIAGEPARGWVGGAEVWVSRQEGGPGVSGDGKGTGRGWGGNP